MKHYTLLYIHILTFQTYSDIDLTFKVNIHFWDLATPWQ